MITSPSEEEPFFCHVRRFGCGHTFWLVRATDNLVNCHVSNNQGNILNCTTFFKVDLLD